MEFAKSLFQGSNEKQGYVGVNTAQNFALVESACDDPDQEILICSSDRTGLCHTINPKPGIAFSAVTPSMWPTEISPLSNGANGSEKIATSSASESTASEDEFGYDELGFKIEEEDGPEQNSNKLLGIPFTEDTSLRLKWLADLEFSHSCDEVHDLSWDSIPSQIQLSQKLLDLMTHSSGIPHSLRPQLWIRLSGALKKKIEQSPTTPYWKIVKESEQNEYFSYAKHIEKDLLRILPGNGCFSKIDSPGVLRLRRVLKSVAWIYPDIGYCQGMGTIVGHLLLFLEEEDCFWTLCTIIENVLPPNYYVSDFIGIRTDALVIGELVAELYPNVDKLLKENDTEIGLIVFPWFLTIFASALHPKILLRVWDWIFCDGEIILFRIVLGLIKFKEPELLQLQNSAEIFNFLSNLPSRIEDFDSLSLHDYDSITKLTIANLRKKMSSQVVTDGTMSSSAIFSSYTNRRIKKRQLTKSKKSQRMNSISPNALLKSIFGDGLNHNNSDGTAKVKNVKQTELMVDLHEAIVQIGHYFIQNDSKFMKLSLEPDFSLESHHRDYEKFTHGFTSSVKRAKALVDFERRDDDELGFRRNDIIVILNSKDEHCWVGELNGLKGWFPAKFVVLLDERSKLYSPAGDDSVEQGIADLTRGILCPALKHIFEHGLRKPSSVIGPIHPWQFIEEVARKEVEKDYRSVNSRLVLCKTYRLDEDGKVLSPEELLFRCVDIVNRSHEKIQMDVKLRSLICLGLNEQVLHLWIEILCSCSEVVNKWYHTWSFLNSPGWVGLKCELRLLAQFSFTLSLDWELRPLKEEKFEVKNGLRDMLVKHHLFSWNLN